MTRRKTFVRRLLRWYAQNHRPLPWRKTRDPYRILVSEIMLQQTQVSRVIPKYHEFLRKYPSIESLSRASAREVREIWYPLGYNVRPVRLRDMARTVVRKHGGRLPATPQELMKLKGVGPYTAGAVSTFAHGKPAPILDTNVRRVLRRVFYADRPVADRILWQAAEDLLPQRRGYDFNQALMDFGATVCSARAPRCLNCPMRTLCAAYPRLRRRTLA